MENNTQEKASTIEEQIVDQMSKKVVHLKKNDAEEIKTVPFGFSLSTLLFGHWVPFFRKDWKYAAVIFATVMLELIFVNADVINHLAYIENKSYIITKLIGRLILPAFAIGSIVFAFIYNKLYIKELLQNGYTPLSEADKAILQKLKIKL